MDNDRLEDDQLEVPYPIERTEAGEFKRLEARNEKIGVRMSVAVSMGVDDRPEKRIEVAFFRLDGSNVSPENAVELISTTKMLGVEEAKAPEVDMDLIEEVIAPKYVHAFQSVKAFTNYDDLVRQVFPNLVGSDDEDEQR